MFCCCCWCYCVVYIQYFLIKGHSNIVQVVFEWVKYRTFLCGFFFFKKKLFDFCLKNKVQITFDLIFNYSSVILCIIRTEERKKKNKHENEQHLNP